MTAAVQGVTKNCRKIELRAHRFWQEKGMFLEKEKPTLDLYSTACRCLNGDSVITLTRKNLGIAIKRPNYQAQRNENI